MIVDTTVQPKNVTFPTDAKRHQVGKSQVPELTRGGDINLNERVSLQRGADALDTLGMKQRQPKDLADKLDESLRVRYSEVVKLRELVRKAESELNDGKSGDQPHDSFSRRG